VTVTDAQLAEIAEREPLHFLELWYHRECTDDRVEGSSLLIEAVDGPGWWISIDLRGTALEGRTMKASVVDQGDGRWRQSWSDGLVFTVATSVLQLSEGIHEFRRFALTGEVAPRHRLSHG
jgi:Immunity protein 53